MLDVPLVLAFIEFISLSNVPFWLRAFLQSISLGTSLLLLYFMIKHRERTFLDNALLLREVALLVLIARLTLLNVFSIQNVTVTNLTYVLFAVAGILVLFAISKLKAAPFLEWWRNLSRREDK